jgi:uncharacterized protein YaaR (DUF327 family)
MTTEALQEKKPVAIDAAASPALTAQEEQDIDSLYILPLHMIPIETPGLKRARLIKNVRLDTVVELFHDPETGSGQVEISELGTVFNWTGDAQHPDEVILSTLSRLHSYDVYTLRMQLRKLGINVDDTKSLTLSPAKKAQLTVYMKSFTMPLIRQIYGDTKADVADVGELISMFASPDRGDALKNLKMMAEKLNIELTDVPKFLEDYGDVFLSLAYYKDCLDELIPQVMAYSEATEELKDNMQMRNDRRLMNSINSINEQLSDITTSITGRFESFERNSESMWDNITAESFAKVKKLISSHHATVGGVLCGLSVKMNSWAEKFANGGGLVRRGDFVMSDMMQGMDRISKIEASAPKITD